MNAKAYTPAKPDFQGSALSRRDALASIGALALAASSIPALADDPDGPSELTRRIEAHRAAEAVRIRAFDAAWDIEEAHGYRDEEAPGLARAKALNKLALQAERTAYDRVITYRPTTFAEVRQLIDYLTSDDCFGNMLVPGETDIGRIFAALSTSGVNPYA